MHFYHIAVSFEQILFDPLLDVCLYKVDSDLLQKPAQLELLADLLPFLYVFNINQTNQSCLLFIVSFKFKEFNEHSRNDPTKASKTLKTLNSVLPCLLSSCICRSQPTIS